jgi:hypothetical protein
MSVMAFSSAKGLLKFPARRVRIVSLRTLGAGLLFQFFTNQTTALKTKARGKSTLSHHRQPNRDVRDGCHFFAAPLTRTNFAHYYFRDPLFKCRAPKYFSQRRSLRDAEYNP